MTESEGIELTTLQHNSQKDASASYFMSPPVKGDRYNHLQHGQEYLLKWTSQGMTERQQQQLSMIVLQGQFVRYFDNRQYSRFLEYIHHTNKETIWPVFADLFEHRILETATPSPTLPEEDYAEEEEETTEPDIIIHESIDYIMDPLSPFYHIHKSRILGHHLGLFRVTNIRTFHSIRSSPPPEYEVCSFVRSFGCVTYMPLSAATTQKRIEENRNLPEGHFWVDLHQVEIRPTISTFRFLFAQRKAIEKAATTFYLQKYILRKLPPEIKQLILSFLLLPME